MKSKTELKKYYQDVLVNSNAEDDNMQDVIEKLDELGFFEAPASTRFHLNEAGGLAQHSINVYEMAMRLKPALLSLCPSIESKLQDRSIAVAALFHDVCKADVYRQVEKSRKNSFNQWEKYIGYDVDYSEFPIGHGEKSVIRLLSWGLRLNEDEMLAIRWHMGPWDLSPSKEALGCLEAAKNKSPLVSLISAADGFAAAILENDFK